MRGSLEVSVSSRAGRWHEVLGGSRAPAFVRGAGGAVLCLAGVAVAGGGPGGLGVWHWLVDAMPSFSTSVGQTLWVTGSDVGTGGAGPDSELGPRDHAPTLCRCTGFGAAQPEPGPRPPGILRATSVAWDTKSLPAHGPRPRAPVLGERWTAAPMSSALAAGPVTRGREEAPAHPAAAIGRTHGL